MTNPKNPYVGTFISTIMFPLFPDEIDLVPGITTHVSPATGFCGNTLQLFSNSPISELVTFGRQLHMTKMFLRSRGAITVQYLNS